MDTADSAGKSGSRKAVQLCTAIRHALTSAIDCDVDDPLLYDLYVYDVVLEHDGNYAALFATDDVAGIEAKQARLRDAAPIFRRALATALSRKRVPTVALFVVPAATQHDGYDGYDAEVDLDG